MKFEAVRDPLPFLIIHNTYNNEQLQVIYRELDFLFPRLSRDAKKTNGAHGENEQGRFSLKKNKGIFLNNFYRNLEYSYINNFNQKIFNDELRLELTSLHPCYGGVPLINTGSTLVSYYEDGDYYLPHMDSSRITLVTWFFKEPKNFTGGDFIFTDRNVRISPRNNMSVVFVGGYKHEVTPVQMIDKSIPFSGRFTLSTFLDYIDVPNN